jgi:hypothetical protein
MAADCGTAYMLCTMDYIRTIGKLCNAVPLPNGVIKPKGPAQQERVWAGQAETGLYKIRWNTCVIR